MKGLIAVLLVLGAQPVDPSRPPPSVRVPSFPSRPLLSLDPLLSATSADGLIWVESAGPLGMSWASPELIITGGPGAEVITLLGVDDPIGASRIMRSTSRDGGRSWSAGSPVMIADLPKDARIGAVAGVATDDGGVRMYVVVQERIVEPALPPPGFPDIPKPPKLPDNFPPPGSPSNPIAPTRPDPLAPDPGYAAPSLRSAISPDGVSFTMEAGERIPGAVVDVEAARVGNTVAMLFVREGKARLARSTDGLAFTTDDRFSMDQAWAPSPMALPEGQVRILHDADDRGVGSSMLDVAKGTTTLEPGRRLRGLATDPACAALPKGGFAMVHRRPVVR